jgi:ribulose-phosphate 3-epimerase
MSIICPTVTASNAHIFRSQMEKIEPYAERIQIDLTDGDFASPKTVLPHEIWWSDNIFCDIHLMYKNPERVLAQLIKLKPAMIIVHAEAEGNFITIAERLRSENIRVGIALLPKTTVSKIKPVADLIDHVLIFAGKLGSQGGRANMELTSKVRRINNLSHLIEVGWDGGIDDSNASLLVKAGVDVLNTGSYIQKAANPINAYAKLKDIAEKS